MFKEKSAKGKRKMVLRLTQAIVVVFFLMFLGCGGGMLYIALTEERCFNLHKFFSLLATILCGTAMLVYRLLPGRRTHTLKYLHMALHTLAAASFGIGVYYAHGREPVNPAHGLPAYVACGAFLLQYAMAFLVYVCCGNGGESNVRGYFSPIHDIVGVWVFACLAGSCISGYANPLIYGYTWRRQIFDGCAIGGCMIVVAVVLCPYFDWNLVGYY